jgi:DNA-binding winged helix-turn-helix (wHTH) protein
LTSDLRDVALSSHIWWGTSVENRRHGLLRIEVPGGDGATPTRSRIVKFGTFEADLNSGELNKSGLRQKLNGQPFEVLCLLLEHPRQIVTREEFQQRIWSKDIFVDYDLALRKAITRLRESLGDSAENPRFIETIPRKGYRFMAPVKEISVEADVAEQAAVQIPISEGPQADTLSSIKIKGQIGEREPRAPKHWRKAAVMGVSAVILVATGYISWRHFRATGPQRSEKFMLAVLPFENLTGDPNKEYLADGLTEGTISQLGRLNPEQLVNEEEHHGKSSKSAGQRKYRGDKPHIGAGRLHRYRECP